MEIVSSSVSSASDKDYDDDPPLKKLCVFLCMHLNAPECTLERLKLPNFPCWGVGGDMPQTPLERMTAGSHVLYPH